MQYKNLKEFINYLEDENELVRITKEVDPYLEITEISKRALQNKGKALLFENVKNSKYPVLTNLFGTTKRIALALGKNDVQDLRKIGELLAELKQPTPPKKANEALKKITTFKNVLNMVVTEIKKGKCQEVIIEADKVDLTKLPIQTCWPEDVSPLITWGLVITKGVDSKRQNLGIYRQQLLAKNKLIMRWLSNRGGCLDFQKHQKIHPNKPFAVSVAIGADPATTLAAVTPIPNNISEYAFAGLLRGKKTRVCKSISNDLQVPADAEIILEGVINPGEYHNEGPFGDHTGYYNEVEKFPVFTVNKITMNSNPIYHSTYTGKPLDEPAVLGLALNEIFIPLLQKQFPEIHDFYLPAAACSYRIAIVSINKQYAGHPKQIMMGIWSFLKQFMYTKFIIVVDEDINIRNWNEVIWAISTRADAKRDTTIIENSAIDYLDFASPTKALGSKMGIDATNKFTNETKREWGRPIIMDNEVIKKIDSIWDDLGID